MKNIYLTAMLAITVGTAIGQAGTPDPTFGNNGIVTTGIGPSAYAGNVCKQVLLHPNGSFYLVFNLGDVCFITRRFADGAVDASYGQNGYSVPAGLKNAKAALQSDGKIVVGGHALIDNSIDFVIARYNSNGTLDNSFSGDGIQTTDFYNSWEWQDYVTAVAVQPDGKIVAAGYVTTAGYRDFALARYNPDGSPDNSFSGDGKLTTSTLNVYSGAEALALQPDGKIVAAGYNQVVRYLPDGTLDNSFSGDGKELYSIYFCRGIGVQADGRIVLGGYAYSTGHVDFSLMRINADGTIDNNFSGDGRLTTDFGLSDDAVEAVLVQPDGKIIAAGSATKNSKSEFAIARYNTDGTLDAGFSYGGIETTAVGINVNNAFSLALQPDGKILLTGFAFDLAMNSGYAVVRYNADGSLDPNFDSDGKLFGYKLSVVTMFNASAVQADDRIITAGQATIGTEKLMVVVRYNTDGTLDNSFSIDGWQSISFGSTDNNGLALAIQADGKIVVGGFAFNGSSNDFALARLNADGTLDNSFSGDGKLLADLSGAEDICYDLKIQPDGKIVMAGFSDFSGDQVFALARFNTDGTPDNTFSGDGKLFSDFGSQSDLASAVIILPDGKILAVGTFDQNDMSGGTKVAVARYLADGSPDNSFDGDGKLVTDVSAGRDQIFDAVLQPDGKIVAAGLANPPNVGHDCMIIRYNSDGTLDNSFSGDGKLTIDLGSTSELFQTLVIQADGKILAGGFAHGGNNNDLVLARFNADGTIDNSFSGDGKLVLDYGYGADYVGSLSIWNNRVYAAGYVYHAVYDGLLAAFLINNVSNMQISIPDAMTLPKGVEKNTVYIGYNPASDLTLSVSITGGTGPFSYLWNNGATTASITVKPLTPTNYSVVVTDAAGATRTASRFVNVLDVRCGNQMNKVLLCMVPPGNTGNASINCVSESAVATHLDNDSYLGICATALYSTDLRIKRPETKKQLDSIEVYPNPGTYEFRVLLKTTNKTLAELTVIDVAGRLVEKRKIFSNEVVQIGSNYRPGTYFIEVKQLDKKLRSKLIKQ